MRLRDARLTPAVEAYDDTGVMHDIDQNYVISEIKEIDAGSAGISTAVESLATVIRLHEVCPGSPAAKAIASSYTRRILKDLPAVAPIEISTESFTENVKDIVKAIWEAIKKAVQYIVDKIKALYHYIVGSNDIRKSDEVKKSMKKMETVEAVERIDLTESFITDVKLLQRLSYGVPSITKETMRTLNENVKSHWEMIHALTTEVLLRVEDMHSDYKDKVSESKNAGHYVGLDHDPMRKVALINDKIARLVSEANRREAELFVEENFSDEMKAGSVQLIREANDLRISSIIGNEARVYFLLCKCPQGADPSTIAYEAYDLKRTKDTTFTDKNSKVLPLKEAIALMDEIEPTIIDIGKAAGDHMLLINRITDVINDTKNICTELFSFEAANESEKIYDIKAQAIAMNALLSFMSRVSASAMSNLTDTRRAISSYFDYHNEFYKEELKALHSEGAK